MDLESDIDATDVPEPEKPQKVWPLFALGFALVAFGYYFVFTDVLEEDSDTGRVVELEVDENQFARVPSELGALDGPVEFSLSSDPRKLRFELSQSTLRASGPEASVLEVSIAFTATDTPVGEGALTYEREYSDIEVAVSENGKPIGGGVAPQVEELLARVVHRLAYAPNGRLEDVSITSIDSAQLRQLVSVVTDATSMVALRFPEEQILVDESWSYRAPYSVSSDNGMDLNGSFVIENVVRGTSVDSDSILVVEQSLSSSATGEFLVEDKPRSVSIQGVGRGVYHADRSSGQLRDGELIFEQVSSLGGDALGVQTTTRVSFEQQSP